TGWATLIPVQVFHQIGLYDDRHLEQCGDTEFTVRAKHAGYRLVVAYRSVVKVHTGASDGINVANFYSFRDLKRYFFDVRSYCRLKYRFFFIYNTATNPVIFTSFFLCDLMRITYHFFRRLRIKRMAVSSLPSS